MFTPLISVLCGKKCPRMTDEYFGTIIKGKRMNAVVYSLKRQFIPKSKIHMFPLICSAIYQSRYIWCEFPSFIDIGPRDLYPFSNTIGVNSALNVVLTALKNTFENLNSNVSFQKSQTCYTR